MGTALWIVQVLLALAFFMAGLMKATQPHEKLGERMAWVKRFSPGTVRFIGVIEMLGAIGLIVPAVTGMLPVLTPVAAVGLVLVMLGAIVTHARAGENAMIVGNLILLALAAFVAYGRFVLVPLTA
jgi:uncharacterized membrane protein YphA (DoxX/SURF4 family)